MAELADLPVEGNKDGIIYKVADIRQFDEALKLYREDFLRREPLLLAAGFVQAMTGAVRDEMDPLGSTASIVELLGGGLSLVARDMSTDEVVGFRMCQVLKKKETEENMRNEGIVKKKKCIEEVEMIFRNVYAYVSDLQNVDFFGRCGVDNVMELAFIVVKESHSRRGIAKELLQRSLNLAKQRGIEAVVVTATNPITVDMFEKLGFEGIRDLTIENYVINGKKAFPCAYSGQFGRLYVKKL